MIIDGKGKLFGKISIIDILIVLILVGAVTAGAAYKFTKSRTPGVFVKTDRIQITFTADEVPEFMIDTIEKDKPARDAVQNLIMGTIKEVKKDKSISYVGTDDGRIIKTSKEGYASAVITVEGTGVYTDSGLTLGNVEYNVGKPMERLVLGKTIFSTSMRIRDIKKID